MPNLMFDFTRTFTEQFVPQSLGELALDAKNIKNTLMQGGRDAQEKYQEIRNSSHFKKVTDFFFRRRDELGATATLEDVAADDEFDAGFPGSGDESPQPKVLDYESMRDITKGQVSSMYEIAGKQAEASAMNTAEIVSSMNSRSSEILSSLGNINSSLTTIAGKLDELVKLSTVQQEMYKNNQKSLFNSSGGLTLGTSFDFMKSRLTERFEQYLMLPSTAKMMLDTTKQEYGDRYTGAMGVGVISGFLISSLLGDAKIFGGRSLNDFSESINERVANIQNDMLSKLFDTKPFRWLFGNVTGKEANEDYSNYIKNQYTRDQAVFDGMTRKTIIDIIPGYLRKITEALTGQTYFISPEGSLTLDRPQGFQQQMSRAITNGLSSKTIERARKRTGTNISHADIHKAQRMLTFHYTMMILNSNNLTLPRDYFDNGGNLAINDTVIDELTAAKGNKKTRAEWEEVVNFIIKDMMNDRNTASTFIRQLTTNAQNMHKHLQNYAETANYTFDIGKVTDDMIKKAAMDYLNSAGGDDRTYGERIEAGEMRERDIPVGHNRNERPSDDQIRKIQRERLLQAESISSIGDTFQKTAMKSSSILTSIYALLNRGINVFAVKRNRPFDKMPMQTEAENSPRIIYPSLPTANKAEEEEVKGKPAEEEQQEEDAPKSSLERMATSIQNIASNHLGNITEKISNEFNLVKEDAIAVKDSITTYSKAEIEKGKLARDLKKMGDSEDEKHDREIANAVLQAMNAAVADGDTQEDMGALQQQISDIKDPALKSRLSSVVEGTLKRSDNKKPASSKLGKILMWGFGAVKNFILPIFSKAKTFITTLGQKLIAPILESLKSSAQKIGRGFTGIKEGLMGSDESDGIFGRIKNRFSKKSGGEEAGTAEVNPYLSSAGAKQDGVYKIQSDGTFQMYNPFAEEEAAEAEHKAKADQYAWTGGEEAGTVDAGEASQYDIRDEEKQRGRLSEAMSKLMEKFKSTDFGKGFMSVFEKHNKKEKPAQTLADQASKGIFDILKSSDGKAGGADTVLSKIVYGITGIQEAFTKALEEMERKQSEGKESEAESDDKSKQKKGAIESGEDASKDKASKEKTESKDGEKKKGFSFDMGKILGGISSILMGIGQAVLTVIASMSGFKALMELGMNILKYSLEPLNKAFQAVYKALKPVVAIVKQILREIVEYVVQICEVVIEILKPFLEVIGPIVEQIMDVLRPLLEVITGLVNVLMVPLTALMKTVVVPILQHIGNTLEVTLGVIQVGFGIVMTVLGGILTAVGFLTKFFTHDDSAQERGEQVFSMGTNLVKSGFSSVVSGMKKEVSMIGDLATGKTMQDAFKDEPEEQPTEIKKAEPTPALHGSPMDGVFGSGDLEDIYGGYGAQGSYANYMNMSKRGCGPVALADAYSRRSGTRVNAMTMASAMRASGSYNESAGTSVAGYINASRAMGMNVRPGGVNAASLRQASPNNPITVIGSGPDFTTRNGNNHYMNVIGTRGSTAYVSNPMTGRVERRSVSSLASSSLLGLYGSGDVGDGEAFKLDEGVQSALDRLKTIVQGIFNLFAGKSATEELEEKTQSAEDENRYNQAQTDVAGLNLSDEEKAALDTRAFELFKAENQKYPKETDAEYQKRYEAAKNRYWTMAATEKVRDKVSASANGSDDGAIKLINDSLGEKDPETGEYKNGALSNFAEGMFKSLDQVESGGFSNLMTSLAESMGGGFYGTAGTAGFYSDKGAKLFTDTYSPTIRENDATGWRQGGEWDATGKTILGEWFKNVIDPNIRMSGAYGRYGGAGAITADAEGTSGDTHSGTDFTVGGDNVRIKSPVDGKVVATNGDDPYGQGYGYFVKIMDTGGDYHILAHMREDPGLFVSVGDQVQGGQDVGVMGYSGHCEPAGPGGQHVHYEVRLDPGGVGDRVNPHTFFRWYEGDAVDAQGRITITDGMNMTWTDADGRTYSSDIFSPYADSMPKFHEWAKEAGLTPAQEAYIVGVSLGEHGKAFVDVLNGTHAINVVRNGHVGLSNWQSSAGEGNIDNTYGATAQEQLRYGFIDNYFAENPKHARANITGLDRYKHAMETVMGRSVTYGDGERWSPILETDLVQGTGFGVGSAVVPDDGKSEDVRTFMFAKDMGAAARYYNWMIDQGYINPISGPSLSASLGAMPTSSDSSLYVDVTSGSMAGNTEAQKAAAKQDQYSGVPTYYSNTGSGGYGYAKNAAGTKLFDYYINPNNNWYGEHPNWINYPAFYNGKRVIITIDKDSYLSKAEGNLGTYVDNYLTQTLQYGIGSTGNTAMTESQLMNLINNQFIGVSDSDIHAELNKIYNNGVWDSKGSKGRQQYFSKWTKMSIDDKIKALNTTYNAYGQKWSLTRQMLSDAMAQAKSGYYVVSDTPAIDSKARLAAQNEIIHGSSDPIARARADSKLRSIQLVAQYQDIAKKGATGVPTTQAADVAARLTLKKMIGFGDDSYVEVQPTPQIVNPFSVDGILSGIDDQSAAQSVIINQYAAGGSKQTESQMQRLMSNTFNVRAVQIEQTLSEMLALMKEKNQRSRNRRKVTSNRSLPEERFSEEGIPQQVERLSVG